MQPLAAPVLPPAVRIRPRTVLIVSADGSFRQRLCDILTGLRWEVRQATGGAEAWAAAQTAAPEALMVDSWLPDLELAEFLNDFRSTFPIVDLITSARMRASEGPGGPYRQELLYALRRAHDTDTAAWNAAPELEGPEAQAPRKRSETTAAPGPSTAGKPPEDDPGSGGRASTDAFPRCTLPIGDLPADAASFEAAESGRTEEKQEPEAAERLPELVGNAPCMLEVSRRVRLVAPRTTPVLIEGPTGSGKELVAEALHRLSPRNRRPFVAINCAAIPEALLEAELFGHTRGAFTGAVQGRIGRIEAADGGTLFLDEIGEMPLGLQSKLLRFIECGELQRVGTNDSLHVDVRIVAATHQPLARHTEAGRFRADLYYRLAVFLIRTPALAEHAGDLPLLVEHFLKKMGRAEPLKRIEAAAMAKLAAHDWPGNVRELEHVLERGAILAGDSALITAREIDFGQSLT